MSILGRHPFWSNLSGAALLAVAATTPILMSAVIDRGYEIAKLAVAEPLALLAVGAALLAGGGGSAWPARGPARTAIIALLAFVMLATGATLASEMPAAAFFGSYFRREGLLAWLAYAGFFLALLAWARDPRCRSRFLDVLLLASVVPCAYAIQQRLDLDFYFVANRDLTRPNGTLGNPIFLAAYFAALLPITVARAWQWRRVRQTGLFWAGLAIIQGGGLLLTQSRGALLAVIGGMLLLGCLLAGYAGVRRLIATAGGVSLLVAVFLLSINSIAVLGAWAQELPMLNRLVFSLDRHAATETMRASRSAATRLGIWQAGNETFTNAPPHRQLLGFGPESAYMHFFPHMPASVMRTEGYWQSNTFDRLHADTLDIGLNFGLLGWLAYALFFSAVMYRAASALFGLTGRRPASVFFAITAGGGMIAGISAALAGLAAAIAPAFGLGVGAGWFCYLVAAAARLHRSAPPDTPRMDEAQWTLLAGLASGLWVFWMDAQVNIPVMTTRLVSFAIAALVLVLADGMPGAGNKSGAVGSDDAPGWIWGTAFCLVAAVGSFLPAVAFEATQVSESRHLWLSLVPMLALLAAGGLGLLAHRRDKLVLDRGVIGAGLSVAIGLPVLFAAGFLGLRVTVGAQLGAALVPTISAASFAVPVFVLAMSLLLALSETRRAATAEAPRLTLADGGLAVAVSAAVAIVAVFAWQALRADVASRVAQWAESRQQTRASEQLVTEAIGIMPHERYYRRQLIFDLLGRAATDLRKFRGAADSYAGVDRNLAAAETAARDYLLRFSSDPWAMLALANVLQFRALHLLRPFDPPGGERAAQEARELFARAQRRFPTQPLLLRNWAQLEFDEGRIADAYRLLDDMEALLPRELEPYSERIVLAKQLNDIPTISATLTRAGKELDKKLLDQLLLVANSQQP